MFLSLFPLLSLALSLVAAGPLRAGASQMVVSEQRSIMRVRVVSPRITVPLRWRETKGPRCIGAQQVLAATLAEGRQIDFHLRDRRRIRAKMDSDCPTIDYYGGFYLQPEDKRICAGRDEIRPRMGGSCRIERFHLMVPQRPR